MKILQYNWVRFDHPKQHGGGVTVYLNNLIRELAQDSATDLYFLSSGRTYCIHRTSPFVREVKPYDPTLKCRMYEIVNSPIVAPQYIMFPYVYELFRDTLTREILIDFIKENGPFDVIHFHNMEGIGLEALNIKSIFPDTKFIYSLHNYSVFCPQVDLWQNNTRDCTEETTSEKCIKCIQKKGSLEKIKCKLALAEDVREHPFKMSQEELQEQYDSLDREYLTEERLFWTPEEYEEMCFALMNYKEKFVEVLNTNMDAILAVSNRVKEIALKKGIQEQKLLVSYIGTKFAEYAVNHMQAETETDRFSIIYLGYMKEAKGFYFLVDSLLEMDRNYAQKIELTLIAKGSEDELREISDRLSNLYYRVNWKNSYTHDELPELFKGKQLGIVPVLWEDNLPQIAIELVTSGIPVLASSLGGAKELCSNRNFVFEAGNKAELISHIRHIMDNRNLLNEYWQDVMELKTLKKHAAELKDIYLNMEKK